MSESDLNDNDGHEVEKISLKENTEKRYPGDSIQTEGKLIDLGGRIILVVICTCCIAFLAIVIASILGVPFQVPPMVTRIIYTSFGIAGTSATFLFSRRFLRK